MKVALTIDLNLEDEEFNPSAYIKHEIAKAIVAIVKERVQAQAEFIRRNVDMELHQAHWQEYLANMSTPKLQVVS